MNLKNGEKKSDKDLEVLKNKDIEEVVIHCSDCEKKDECDCYKDLKNNYCPVCRKKLK